MSAQPPPRPPPLTGAERRALAVVLAALAVWGACFIVLTSFSLGAERYFVLFDDAMVSMAYARNLAAGHGLVWTAGSEPVEGFTNPLWTALMVAANALPLAPWHVSAVVQVLGLLLLAATVWRVSLLLRAHFPGAARLSGWLPPAALTAFFYPLAFWSLFGMETSLQALLAVLAVHLAYDVVFAGRDRHLELFAVCAAAYLLRMDMAPLVAVTLAWTGLHGGFRWRARRRWTAGAAILVACVGGYQLFRLAYFGEWLPNTYHLKLGGVPLDLRLGRGFAKLLGSLRESAILWAAIVAGAIGSPARWSRTALPGLLLLTYAAYSVWVGGDAWELPEVNVPFNRFVVFMLPLGFVVVGDLLDRSTRSLSAGRRRTAIAAATAILLLAANGLLLSPRREENLRRLVLAERPLFVGSHALVLSRLRRLEELVAPGAEVVTYWAGLPAYFSRYRLIDAMGYADRHIARRPLPPDLHWSQYTPGHQKADPLYLLSRRPDAFFQFWVDIDALPLRRPRHRLRRLGYVQVEEFWLRRDSPYLASPAVLLTASPAGRADGGAGPR